MKTTNTNTVIIDGYIKLLNNLNLKSKLELISKLTQSINFDISNRKNSFMQAFGAFQTKKSAEEIIREIRSGRKFNRDIEAL